MKTIQIFDPAMCCNTGVCGPKVDPILPQVAGFLSQLKERGVLVERFNLAQQPMAFAQNLAVRALLNDEGLEALPLFYIDGVLALKGRYPDHDLRAEWICAHVKTESSKEPLQS
jgi:hypothetical protein